MEKSNKNIPFVKRNTDNNTHENIVDESIVQITYYRINIKKSILAIFLYLLTFGVLFILTFFSVKLYLFLNCDECEIHECNYFLVKDSDKKLNLCEAFKEDYFEELNHTRIEKKDVIDSQYMGDEKMNSSEKHIVFEYRNNFYIYLNSENSIVPLKFDISKFTNNEIHNLLGNGIQSPFQYRYLQRKFGRNKIELKNKSILHIFFEQLLHPFYLYQGVTIVIWIKNDYLSFTIIIIIMILVILLVNSYYTNINYNKILKFSLSLKTTVKRDFVMEGEGKILTDSVNLVPGDIIEIESGETLPCDALLLEGYCNVNESDLTGESNLVMKTPLIHDNTKFSFSKSKKSFLFHGTVINKCESQTMNGKIKALVINIGFNTNRGNLIQNILFPKESNFSFYSEIKVFFIGIFIIYVCSLTCILYFYNRSTKENEQYLEDYFKNFQVNKFQDFFMTLPNITSRDCIPFTDGPANWQLSDCVENILDLLTVTFPPILPISMTFTSFYFHYNLNKKKISCINDQKMNAAGRVNIIVLDKTGTLTEEGLELYGFQTTRVVPFSLEKYVEFDDIEQSAKILNIVHKEFWKRYCIDPNERVFEDYKNALQNNMVYFVECLATCHSIDKLKGETLGNSVDKKIYDTLGWIQEKSSSVLDNENGILKYDMIPKNFHKITEDAIFKAGLNTITGKQYKLTIIKRFEFSSKFQSNSVITYNHLDNSYRYFIKGAPEKIMQLCNPTSLPLNFSKELLNQTQNGYRVLACASKPLESNDTYDSVKEREIFEENLNFLGFIIFKNKLKRDTKNIIGKLKESNCQLLIATGDNPFTTISVARECELVEYNQDIYFLNLEKDPNMNVDKLKWYNIKITPDGTEQRENVPTNFQQLIFETKQDINKGIEPLKFENKEIKPMKNEYLKKIDLIWISLQEEMT